MENDRELEAVHEALPATVPSDEVKAGIDSFLDARSYLIKRIIPLLVEGVDFNIIRNRKVLGKSGSEKIAGIYRFQASFKMDHETMAALGANGGLVAYVCTLMRGGEFCGEGRGADTVDRNQGDPNKTVKMAQKRAYVDAVIRATGISDLFTQDLEDLSPEELAKADIASRVEPGAESLARDERPRCPGCGKTLLIDREDPEKAFCWKKKGGCGWKGALPRAQADDPIPSVTPTTGARFKALLLDEKLTDDEIKKYRAEARDNPTEDHVMTLVVEMEEKITLRRSANKQSAAVQQQILDEWNQEMRDLPEPE